MIERIRELAYKAANGMLSYDAEGDWSLNQHEAEKFAELIIRDYAKKTIQGLMCDPAFVQAMDEYYEQKWAHRFD